MIRALWAATSYGYAAMAAGAGLYVAAAANDGPQTAVWMGRLFVAGVFLVIFAGIPARILESKGPKR